MHEGKNQVGAQKSGRRPAEERASTRLLSSSQVAARLGVSMRTVRDYFASGELPGFKIGRGRLWRCNETDVMAYVEHRRSLCDE